MTRTHWLLLCAAVLSIVAATASSSSSLHAPRGDEGARANKSLTMKTMKNFGQNNASQY